VTAPEAEARRNIDRQLEAAGWVVQDVAELNLAAGRGVAVREFALTRGHGFADYMLYVEGQAIGVVEAKAEGATLTGVEIQTTKYSEGLPVELPAYRRPLPFLYLSTGVETRFTNLLDPDPRSRQIFAFHQPTTLRQWAAGELARAATESPGPRLITTDRPATTGYVIGSANLRRGLRTMPPVPEEGLWPAQLRAVRNLERSLAENRPRALIQMATGSGKTYTAVTSIYRLIKHASARRVLFLVDRGNLGRQAKAEFDGYVTPDENRYFTELYNVQHLASNKVDPVARVCIATIQRLYSILKGEQELDEEADETSLGEIATLVKEPVPVAYNAALPIEHFDVIFIDECHRSIYTLWRQVLEYFDAFLIGLTATPSKQTFGFFNRNLVVEYGHQQAVADHVNVDFDVYRIRTRISERGSTVEAGYYVDRRDRDTRERRWERLDEDLSYEAVKLDRDVVAMDQIRTVVRTFKDRLFTDMFPGRTEVPKALVFAKSDSHADDIVQVIREEFGRGNDFCQKITYRTTGKKTDELIRDFRNDYNPRIAVTVDMVATGTDIRPLEIVLFMRDVKSRVLFEQMKGRGVRVITADDLKAVTRDAEAKTRFVVVDAVGVTEREEYTDAPSLERKPTVATEKLLKAIAMGSTDADIVSTLAGRLARLDLALGPAEKERVREVSGGPSLQQITAGIVEALDPDVHQARARERLDLDSDAERAEDQVATVREELIRDAVKPIATNPALRHLIDDLRSVREQTIDTVSQDEVVNAGYDAGARERARSLVTSFEAFIEEHQDEITALQVLLGSSDGRRPTHDDIRALAAEIQAPPRQWTTEQLWHAYEALDASRVRRSPEQVLTNIVSLVRFAMHRDDILEPFPDRVNERFGAWMAEQEQHGRAFTDEQRRWLEMIRDHIAANLEISGEDFEYAPFVQKGGRAAAQRVFGAELKELLDELMGVLAA
jgi:type I restriction enzyme, R subunit